MVSLAANWDPAGRRECNDAHLHGGIELDDRPDLLRGWRRFDYGHRIPVGNTGSRMNTRRACAGRPQWRNYRARPLPRKTQRGGALCPGPKLPVRSTYRQLTQIRGINRHHPMKRTAATLYLITVSLLLVARR